MSTNTHTDGIFASTACLTDKELAAYCGGRLDKKSQHRMERHLTDCALCSAAVAAFAATPAALSDIPRVKSSVAAKAGKIAVGLGTGFVVAFAVLGILGSAALIRLVFWPEKEKKVQAPVAVVQKADSGSVQPAVSVALLPEEHFIKPGAPVHRTVSPVPSVAPVDTQTKEKVEVEPFEPVAAKEVHTVAEKPAEARETEAPVKEISYNSPVVYVRDLKITDFDKYYREKVRIVPFQLPGVAARYENDKTDKLADAETERLIPADKILDDGLNYFNQGRYGKCISQFDLLLGHNSADINAQFYIAVCDVRLEMFGRALPLLDQVLASPNNTFHQEAEWYKALALAGAGQREKAKELLRQIISGKGFYSRQATEKLAGLE